MAHSLLPKAGALLLLWCALSSAQMPSSTASPSTPSPTSTSQTTSQSAAWFAEAGAYAGSNLMGGLGAALTVANNQEIFGEIALQTGESVAQSSTLLIGVKTNYPSFKMDGRKFAPFTIIAYGTAIQSVVASKIIPSVAGGLTASTINSIGTSAGFAQEYAGGLETSLVRGWSLGVGFTGDKNQSGWAGYPFAFVSKSFGNPK